MIRVDRLPAARAESALSGAAHEVGPLGQVGLAEDHRAGVAKPLDDERVPRDGVVRQRERAGRGPHLVVGGDDVLEDNRDAVQRTPVIAPLEFFIEVVRDRPGVGVGLDHRPQVGRAAVQLVDPVETGGDELGDGERTTIQILPQLADADLFDHVLGIDTFDRFGTSRGARS